MKTPRFAIKTFGCKVNQYEEQVMRENLLRCGFREAENGDADVFIVNSCTVTGEADRKTRQLVRKVKRENPGLKIFLTGCYAVFDEDIETVSSMREVDAVIPLKDKCRLPLILESLLCDGQKGRISAKNRIVKSQVTGFKSHTRAFLKMQDGCDQNCAYCKVSLVRGRPWSRGERDIVEEAARLVRRGYREIVLTGICLGSWKGSRRQGIPELLKEIDRIEGDFRIRISSLEPNHIDDSLIEVIAASERICSHLHIPLQSGSDRVLRSMGRRYTALQYMDLIGCVRKAIPLAGVTMDLIAGFPGEDENDFDSTLSVIRQAKPSRLHVFKYSDRKGTRAFQMKNKVSSDEAQKRVECLIKEGKKLQLDFCRKFVGHKVDVLVEKRQSIKSCEGYTGEYLRAELRDQASLGPLGTIPEGDIVEMEVSGVDEKNMSLITAPTRSVMLNGHIQKERN